MRIVGVTKQLVREHGQGEYITVRILFMIGIRIMFSLHYEGGHVINLWREDKHF